MKSTTITVTSVYDDNGKKIARIVNHDPTHPKSWAAEYDQDGRCIAKIYRNNPRHPNSWRSYHHESFEYARICKEDVAHQKSYITLGIKVDNQICS